MNVRLGVEVENKNNYPLYRPMLRIASVCQGKYQQKKKKKNKEIKKKIWLKHKPN